MRKKILARDAEKELIKMLSKEYRAIDAEIITKAKEAVNELFKDA